MTFQDPLRSQGDWSPGSKTSTATQRNAELFSAGQEDFPEAAFPPCPRDTHH